MHIFSIDDDIPTLHISIGPHLLALGNFVLHDFIFLSKQTVNKLLIHLEDKKQKRWMGLPLLR